MYIKSFLIALMNLFPCLLLAWSSPITISGLGINFNPVGKINENGEAIVAWSNGAPSIYTIQTSTYNGFGWSSPEAISVNSNPAETRIAFNSAGNIIVLWNSMENDNFIIRAIQKPSITGAWSDIVQLSSSESNNSPNLAMNESGQAIAGWVDSINETVQIASLNFGGSWTPASVISSSVGQKANLKLDIDSNGNGIAIWDEMASNSLVAARYLNGVWSSPQVITTDLSTHLSLSVGSGKSIISWTKVDTGEIQTSIYENETWSSSQTISSRFSGYPQSINVGNDCFVSWWNIGTGMIESARYVLNAWEQSVNLSTNSINSAPVITGLPTTSFTAWTDLVTRNLCISEYSTDSSPISPTNITNENLNISPNLTSSSSATLVSWEAIVGADHVIQISIN